MISIFKKSVLNIVLYRNLVTLQAYLRPVHFMGSRSTNLGSKHLVVFFSHTVILFQLEFYAGYITYSNLKLSPVQIPVSLISGVSFYIYLFWFYRFVVNAL